MENKLHSFLVDWTINFIKNKDIVAKKIEKIENGKDGFDLYVKYKDKEQYFIIAPNLADIDSIMQRIVSCERVRNEAHSHSTDKLHFTIVTLNSKENFEAMLKSWDKLINFKFLSIIFVNPFSDLDKKWIVFPYTHHKISDDSSLKNGLKTIFEMVEPIEEQQLIAKITG